MPLMHKVLYPFQASQMVSHLALKHLSTLSMQTLPGLALLRILHNDDIMDKYH